MPDARHTGPVAHTADQLYAGQTTWQDWAAAAQQYWTNPLTVVKRRVRERSR